MHDFCPNLLPTTHHVPQEVVPDGTPLLNHNVQNTETGKKFRLEKGS